MRIFILRIFQFGFLLCFLAGLYILLIYARPELVDDFYRRFTTDRSPSLVIGTSRSAQGIMPSIINNEVCSDKNKIINHSFAIGPSSFGQNYFAEIKQKLKPAHTDGIFIISVDPWSLATNSTNSEDDSLKFYEVEEEMFVGNLSSSSRNPNFEYLRKYWNNHFSVFGKGFKHLINYKGLLELHEDGWLEVNIELDSAYIVQRIINSTEEYRAKDMFLSNTRISFLEQIVKYLDAHGKVYLVRLPVSSNMAELEKEKFPEFNRRIVELATKYHLPYFNFIDESGDFITVDTHHLYKKESEKITHRICDSINSYSKISSLKQDHISNLNP